MLTHETIIIVLQQKLISQTVYCNMIWVSPEEAHRSESAPKRSEKEPIAYSKKKISQILLQAAVKNSPSFLACLIAITMGGITVKDVNAHGMQ